jgi:hypothetical protein
MISFTATHDITTFVVWIFLAVLRYATADYSTHFRVSQAQFAAE